MCHHPGLHFYEMTELTNSHTRITDVYHDLLCLSYEANEGCCHGVSCWLAFSRFQSVCINENEFFVLLLWCMHCVYLSFVRLVVDGRGNVNAACVPPDTSQIEGTPYYVWLLIGMGVLLFLALVIGIIAYLLRNPEIFKNAGEKLIGHIHIDNPNSYARQHEYLSVIDSKIHIWNTD